MQLKQLALGATLALSAIASAHADTLTTTWSDWAYSGLPQTALNHPVTAGVGTLNADAGSDFAATLAINHAASGGYGGFYADFYYTGATLATFALTSALVEEGVSTIEFSAEYGGYTFTQLPTLTIGSQTYTFDSLTTTEAPKIPGFDFAINTEVYSWDVSQLDLAAGATYQINWQYNAHVAFTELTTSQIAAVPEPATYAMMLAGLAGVGLSARRRRSQRTQH